MHINVNAAGIDTMNQSIQSQTAQLAEMRTQITRLLLQASSEVYTCNISAATIRSQQTISAFTALNRDSKWSQLSALPLDSNIYHPQGIVAINDTDGQPTYFISTVDVINRTAALGRGFVMKYNASGNLIASVQIGDGATYHPGGIDYDGEYIYVPVAEYRPGAGVSIIYRVQPTTMVATELFRFTNDHVGAIVHNLCEVDIFTCM